MNFPNLNCYFAFFFLYMGIEQFKGISTAKSVRSQGYLQERNPHSGSLDLWSSATLQSRSLFLELCLVDLGILTCQRRCPSPGKLRFRASFYYGFPLKTPQRQHKCERVGQTKCILKNHDQKQSGLLLFVKISTT